MLNKFFLIEHIVLHLQKSKFDLSEIIDFQETIVTATSLKKGISQNLTKVILSDPPCVQALLQTHTQTHTHTHTHTHTRTEAHKEKYTITHTHNHCSSKSNHSGVIEFLKTSCKKKYLSAVAICSEYQETLENQDNFFQLSFPKLVYPAGQRRIAVRSTGAWATMSP